MSECKRYAIVGTGGRVGLYIDGITTQYAKDARLVAFCDISQTRMNYWNRHLVNQNQVSAVPTYKAGHFARMIREHKPDVVIVTTIDGTHDEYIIKALDLDCDVITEKPMTTDERKTAAIFEAVRRSGRTVTVTFNNRYRPPVTLVRQLIEENRIGQPLAVDFTYMLDTSHGADYFRRWHREKEQSGGLLVHKSSHHFDMVNFWLNSTPATVVAMGELKFYGRENAAKRGEASNYARYTGVPEAENDPFALSLDSTDSLKGLYKDAEAETGYLRDRNVFGEGITSEDTMAVLARYHNGAQLNYSLITYSPWEGLRVAITGTKGRLELYERKGSHIIRGQSVRELEAEQARSQLEELTLFPMFGVPHRIEIPKASGSHGGGDRILLEQLFSANPAPDPFNRSATHVDGAAAVLLGVAANKAMETGTQVNVDQLLTPRPTAPASAVVDRPVRRPASPVAEVGGPTPS